jgi:hypothetical protein
LNKFFSTSETAKFKEQNKLRKLILTSSSLQVGNIFNQVLIDKDVRRETENTRSYLNGINTSIVEGLEIIQSDNFMNKDQHFSGINISLHFFEDGRFDKKFRHMFRLLKDSLTDKTKFTIICCSESSSKLIHSQFTIKRLNFAIIDDCKILK